MSSSFFKTRDQKILQDYQLNGSDHHSDLSRKRNKFIAEKSHENFDDDDQGKSKKSKSCMTKPHAQIYADVILAIVCLICMLIKLRMIKMNKHPKFLKAFDNIFPKVSPIILVMYVLKPFLIWFNARCNRMTNQSFYAGTLYVKRIVFNIFLIFFPSISMLFRGNIDVIELIMFIAPVLILEIIIYHISVKEAIKKAERINFRMIKTKINTEEQNNEMFSTDDEDHSERKEAADGALAADEA